jgi:hypothetical protein
VITGNVICFQKFYWDKNDQLTMYCSIRLSELPISESTKNCIISETNLDLDNVATVMYEELATIV